MDATGNSAGPPPAAPAAPPTEAPKRKSNRRSLRSVPLLSANALDDLIEKQRTTAAEKKRLTKELRYAKRKRARTVRRVQLLSNDDLASLIEERMATEGGDDNVNPQPEPAPPTRKASDADDGDTD